MIFRRKTFLSFQNVACNRFLPEREHIVGMNLKTLRKSKKDYFRRADVKFDKNDVILSREIKNTQKW